MKLAYYMGKNLAANPENLVNVALATLPQLFGIFALDFFAFTTALSLDRFYSRLGFLAGVN